MAEIQQNAEAVKNNPNSSSEEKIQAKEALNDIDHLTKRVMGRDSGIKATKAVSSVLGLRQAVTKLAGGKLGEARLYSKSTSTRMEDLNDKYSNLTNEDQMKGDDSVIDGNNDDSAPRDDLVPLDVGGGNDGGGNDGGGNAGGAAGAAGAAAGAAGAGGGAGAGVGGNAGGGGRPTVKVGGQQAGGGQPPAKQAAVGPAEEYQRRVRAEKAAADADRQNERIDRNDGQGARGDGGHPGDRRRRDSNGNGSDSDRGDDGDDGDDEYIDVGLYGNGDDSDDEGND